jgi:hypothetical protein
VSLFHEILFNEQSSEKKKFMDLNPELWGEISTKKRRLFQLEGEKKKIAKTCTSISSFCSGNAQRSRYI